MAVSPIGLFDLAATVAMLYAAHAIGAGGRSSTLMIAFVVGFAFIVGMRLCGAFFWDFEIEDWDEDDLI